MADESRLEISPGGLYGIIVDANGYGTKEFGSKEAGRWVIDLLVEKNRISWGGVSLLHVQLERSLLPERLVMESLFFSAHAAIDESNDLVMGLHN